ncbi:hypothetical protein [Mucilaginibacter boryungensis]|uniref:Uncharacterized protein n=1 Tax=Mucilaginibacter boryungensis TaxID=768480 RepID=A0ABR9XMN5_9SPHI|nr:hypothetical protein [Mucilaginibacter boryungensis]MBE9668275.1 hypothetical protein [Mucilaginibacter boryungensis]
MMLIKVVLRVTDPDGMGVNDWVKRGNKYVNDDRVVDQKTAIKYEGEGAKYIGKSATIYSKWTASLGSGRVHTERVSLGKDGSVSKSSQTEGFATWEHEGMLKAGESGTITNSNGSEFMSKQTTGSFVGLSASFAALGGFGIGAGMVHDATGQNSMYFSVGATVGLGSGAGLDLGTITPTGNRQFYNSNFSGNSSTFSVGLTTPVVGVGYSGGVSTGPTGYTTQQVGFSPGGKMNVGAIFQVSDTWVSK